jgi:hypothetical protein
MRASNTLVILNSQASLLSLRSRRDVQVDDLAADQRPNLTYLQIEVRPKTAPDYQIAFRVIAVPEQSPSYALPLRIALDTQRPRYVFLITPSAGLSDAVGLGDVVINNWIYSYTSFQTLTGSEWLERSYECSPSMTQAAEKALAQDDVLRRVASRIKFGNICSVSNLPLETSAFLAQLPPTATYTNLKTADMSVLTGDICNYMEKESATQFIVISLVADHIRAGAVRPRDQVADYGAVWDLIISVLSMQLKQTPVEWRLTEGSAAQEPGLSVGLRGNADDREKISKALSSITGNDVNIIVQTD